MRSPQAPNPRTVTMLLAFTLLCMAWSDGIAQKLPGNFERFTRDSGLPQNYVSGMVRDDQGFLWLGTREGLAIFDGSKFRVLDLSSKIPGGAKQIWPRLVDDSNRLWSYTNNAILGYHISDGSSKIYEFQGFGSVFQDSRGQVFLIVEDQLLRIEAESWDFESMITFGSKSYILGIDELDHVWLSQTNIEGKASLTRYDTASRLSTSYDIPESIAEITAFHKDSEGSIWIGSTNGLFKFDIIKSTWKAYAELFQKERISGIAASKSGKLWVMSWSKLYEFDPSSNEINFEKLDPENTPIYANELYVDSEGIVWIGSRTGGLIRLKPRTNLFTQFGGSEANDLNLPSNLVMSLSEFDEELLIGALRGGISSWDPSTSSVLPFNLTDLESGLGCSDSIWDVVSKNDTIWLGTSDGLCISKDSGRSFRHVKPPTQISPRAVVSTMELSRNGKFIWIGLYDGQVLNYDIVKEEFSSVPLPRDQENSVSGPIWALKESTNGDLWIGNSNSGLCRYSSTTGIIDIVNGDEDYRSIFEDSRGRLWVAGLSGLSLLETDPIPKLRKVNANSSSPGQIFSIAEDKLGRLWLGTVNGIWLYTANNLLMNEEDLSGWFTSFSPDQGMPSMEFNRRAVARIGDELFFGGSGGFISFEPESIPGPTDLNRVHLTFAHIIGKEGVKEEHIYQAKKVEIEPGDYAFTFDFSSPDMKSKRKKNYWVYLEGFDLNWIDIDERQNITYTNVPPGSYPLYLAEGESSPHINPDLQAVTIVEIRAPWWRTKTFLALSFLGLLLLGALAYQTRIRYLKKRARELRTEVGIRTRELSLEKKKTDEQSERLKDLDAAKNRFFSNLSHEFRTPLTLIISPIQYALEGGYDGAPDKLKAQHKLVLSNANKLLILINQLLDLAKIDSRKMELHRLRRNLVPIVREIVKGFSSVAEYRGILLRYEMPKKSVYAIVDEEKIRAVFENLLTNALKYTPKDGIVVVRVDQVTNDNGENKVRIVVKDSGQGIPSEDIPHLFKRFYQAKDVSGSADPGTGIGLSLANELVLLHNGQIEVESELGKGSTFIVSLPSTPAPAFVDDDSDTMIDGYGALKMLIGSDKAKSFFESENEVDGPSILLVEDNFEMRQLIVTRLKDDFRIREAENGLIALDMVKEQRPDLILMDVLMPKMSGIEACVSLKQSSEFADIPIILISAKATEEARLEGFDAGADDYLEKPFNISEMTRRISNLIESRKRLKQRYESSIRILPEQPSLDKTNKNFVQSLVKAVESQLSDANFNEHSLARSLNISEKQLKGRTKELFGKSPIDFIDHVKMEKAVEILTKKRSAISDIAHQLGFESATEFSAAFKTRFGQSPSEFSAQESDD